MRRPPLLTLLLIATLSAGAARAQQVAFGGMRADSSAPVEVASDSLAVDQEGGTATFTGHVIISQGAMRLQAGEVRVEYANPDRSRIERLHASGGVTLVSDKDAAESKEAVYTIASGEVVMTGDVLLTQGSNVMAGQKLVVDLKTGTGRMDGRVRTTLQPGTGGN